MTTAYMAGIVFAVIGAVLIVMARRTGALWVRLYGLDRSKLLPSTAAPWAGALFSVVLGIGLIAAGTRALGWWH
ncbi:MAG: hypothetical protein Q7W30_08805 [Coriobacteriia bacterium]|nr:hypothetical protein [Coriobacteriia bacterium]